MGNDIQMVISIELGQNCLFAVAYRKLSVWFPHQNCQVIGIEAFEPNGN
jgi:hypothetical protein